MTGVKLGSAVTALPLLVGLYFWWIGHEHLTHRAVYYLALAKLGQWDYLQPEMVKVPTDRDCSVEEPCSFLMGSAPSDPAECAKQGRNECPQHAVTFPKPFKIGKYEVTFDEYEIFRRLMEQDGGCKDGHKPRESDGQDSGFGRGERPMINVSWEDARCYADWLSRKTGNKYRQPTEAEWEYAARAGTATDYSWEEPENQAEDYAWFSRNSDSMTHPVGQKRPNGFGLYDMAGNVWEWVEDCYQQNYDGAPADGKAWEPKEEDQEKDCGLRVIRGVSWSNEPEDLRSANRIRSNPDSLDFNLGFRLAQDL